MKRITLNQTIPGWTSAGIFHYLNALAVPWDGDITDTSLDLDYHGGHSGRKRITPLVETLLESDGTLDATSINMLAVTALALFGVRWTKMYEQLSIEYNPIHNYDMTESETTSGSGSGSENHTGADTRTISHGTMNSGQDTRTNTGTQTSAQTGTQGTVDQTATNTTGSSNTDDGIAGFNSTTYQKDRNSVSGSTAASNASSNSTRTDNLQDQRTDNLTETTTHGHNISETGSDALQHGESIARSESSSGSRSMTRSGNIGVTTTAMMLEQERTLWAWNFFRNVVYPDLDSLLTLQTY